ncbi:putative transcriptional regulator [Alkalispirochaeta americana]|uniref:UPF0301 protein SAMN05920897_11387 n=1 Tax=Alkalispirochaeta americana TaxID=159291 RepID=A0A1N6V0W9_9SPIO|nr:YqgE/AlgH family protein [Alkalispirochaeta americana]SIQ71488.1 putative transcriptional regulator [Alkalispirochaeta americana]
MSALDDRTGAHPPDLTGYFLIAETDLQDPNFFRAVVLLVDHNEEGAFGLVVNRESEVVAGDVLDNLERSPASGLKVYVGGPVQQNYIFVLHSGIPRRYHSDHALEPCKGVFFEPSFQHILDYMASEDYLALPEKERPQVRVFAGYSGWAPGQLEEELRSDSWFIHPASPDLAFQAHATEGWKKVLSEKGGFYRIVAQTGFKPSLN